MSDQKESNVVALHEYMALCPQCDGNTFNIHVQGPHTVKDGTVDIIGTECVNCKARIRWEPAMSTSHE